MRGGGYRLTYELWVAVRDDRDVAVTSDAAQDECRRDVAGSGLTPEAVTHLTRDALGTIDLANLAPVKALLKRFFSEERWTRSDDDALADLVGSGNGWFRHELDSRFAFEYGWRAGRFRLELSRLRNDQASPRPGPQPTARVQDAQALDGTFDGFVVPEATPNPGTVRFMTPTIHDGPSRWYTSAADVDDPRVARLFDTFTEVDNVLVGPDFVAVGLHRPDGWEQLLDSVLRVVTAEFATTTPQTPEQAAEGASPRRTADARSSSEARPGRLDRAWRELSVLRPDDPRDLERLLAALSATDVAERQVAARLMVGVPDAAVAETAWSRLLDDPSRTVRRATVDAMVDAARVALRPLLERALDDPDAWTRWKALRGLVELGIEPSRGRIAPLIDDPDFRVRLETGRALRQPGG